jgi:hypothetical protein
LPSTWNLKGDVQMMMSGFLIAQRCSQKRYNAIFYAMEMRSSVAQISLIIRKLQFCLKSNQEPGKISHVCRYRMNLYHSNYAFARRFLRNSKLRFNVSCIRLHLPFNMWQWYGMGDINFELEQRLT